MPETLFATEPVTTDSVAVAAEPPDVTSAEPPEAARVEAAPADVRLEQLTILWDCTGPGAAIRSPRWGLTLTRSQGAGDSVQAEIDRRMSSAWQALADQARESEEFRAFAAAHQRLTQVLGRQETAVAAVAAALEQRQAFAEGRLSPDTDMDAIDASHALAAEQVARTEAFVQPLRVAWQACKNRWTTKANQMIAAASTPLIADAEAARRRLEAALDQAPEVLAALADLFAAQQVSQCEVTMLREERLTQRLDATLLVMPALPSPAAKPAGMPGSVFTPYNGSPGRPALKTETCSPALVGTLTLPPFEMRPPIQWHSEPAQPAADSGRILEGKCTFRPIEPGTNPPAPAGTVGPGGRKL